jgi:hypothetical protein
MWDRSKGGTKDSGYLKKGEKKRERKPKLKPNSKNGMGNNK